MMNKWVLRLVGVLILGVLAMLFYDVWFRPPVPDTLQDEISLQVGDQRPTRNEGEQSNSPNDGVVIPNVPNIELTSLEDLNEPAVLSNPHPELEPESERIPDQSSQQPQSTSHNAPSANIAAQGGEQAPSPSQPTVSPGGAWVQVGSFADNKNAQKMVAQMHQRQWPTDTEVANVNGKSYHRVFVGPLAASDVPDYLQQLQSMGINAREVTR